MPSRVLHVSTVHPWSDPRILRREITTLNARGYEMHWMVAAADDANTPHGVTLHPIRAQGRYARSVEVLRLARAVGADLIHLHDPELLVIADALRRATGALVVYDKHEYYRGRSGVKSSILRWAERILLSSVDGIVVVEHADATTDTADRTAEGTADLPRPDVDDLVVPDVPVIALPNYPVFAAGSQPSVKTIRDPSSSPIRLVYTGVIAAERGLWTMLDVVEEIASRGREVELTVAGVCHRPAERERFEASVKLRGRSHHIRRVGWDSFASWDVLFAEVQAADIGFMLMDRNYRSWSNIPTKFYEYMHAGLPFVCTDYPNWKSFVMQHDCGVAVDHRDGSSIADEVLRLADSPGRRERMSVSARAAAPEYSWKRVEERLVSLYESLGVFADETRRHPD